MTQKLEALYDNINGAYDATNNPAFGVNANNTLLLFDGLRAASLSLAAEQLRQLAVHSLYPHQQSTNLVCTLTTEMN